MSTLPSASAPPAIPAALLPLVARAGLDYVQHRLARERLREARGARSESLPWRWFNKHTLIRTGLRASGLHARGRRNALAIQHVHHALVMPRLPASLEGLRLLQLSDLHLDIDRAFVDTLARSVQGLQFDACVLTGDYRFRSFGPTGPAMAAMARLRPSLGEKVWAVLGNHDALEMVPVMEAMGIDVLLNEATVLAHQGAVLALAGVDDAHAYRLQDLPRAFAACAPQDCKLLLCHTPEPYAQAAALGFDAMLSGHTHGGQVCLPGGIPVMASLRTPRRYVRGAWQEGAMAGYTSVGCGSSIIDVRLNNLPEVTLHRLTARG